MIVTREIFQLHFGKAREALEAMREGVAVMQRLGLPSARLLTDVTGPYYTLVLEIEYGSLADLEAALGQSSTTPEWREWYARFVPCVREGRREVFRLVEMGRETADVGAREGVRGL